MKYPTLQAEKRLWKKGFKKIAGLDEAGRGPLAGPVVAAAVIIKDKKLNRAKLSRLNLDGINDSKKLTPRKREKLYGILTNPLRHPLRHSSAGGPQIEWGVGRASEKIIDKINILEATKLAMKRAIKNLATKKSSGIRPLKVDFLILDGKMKLDLNIPQKAIVRADEKVFSCSVASIIAKVSRDRIMQRFHKKYPRYGFDKHKGYPTRLHQKMLKKYGPSEIHRKSFKPVASLLVITS